MPCFAALLLGFLLGGAPARAADPVADILRLVPPDASLCVVVRDLRTHLKAIGESPFAAWVVESALGKQHIDPKDMQKIKELERFLADQIGVTGEELVADILGDAVVLAYRPGGPQEEATVAFVNARKPELLDKLLRKLSEHQVKSQEVKAAREKTHAGRKYLEREKADGAKEYAYRRDGILAFSGQERAIQAVIDQDVAPAGKPGKVEASLSALGLSDKMAVCWFNPRGFDAELKANANAAEKPDDKAFLAQFAKVWAAADGVALYAHPGRGLEFGLVAAIERDRLPKVLQPLLFPPAGQPVRLAAPADAIAAVSGRVNLPLWIEALKGFLPDPAKAELTKTVEQGFGAVVGKDKLAAVLAGLGPDWAAWVTPPDPATGNWVPEWTAAVKLTPTGGVDVPKVVLQAVDFAAQLIRVAYNKDHDDQIEWSEETRDGLTVRVLSNPKAFPAGFRPAYAVAHGYLVVASSPESVRRFAPRSSDDEPVLRFSAKQLRAYLDKHRSAVAEQVAKWSKRPVKDVEKEVGDVVAGLELLDRLEVRQSSADGRFRLAVHVEFSKPLRK